MEMEMDSSDGDGEDVWDIEVDLFVGVAFVGVGLEEGVIFVFVFVGGVGVEESVKGLDGIISRNRCGG